MGACARIPVLALCVVALCPFASVLPNGTQQVPPTLFGLTDLFAGQRVSWATPWPVVPFGAMRLWDSGTSWAEIETSRGVYNWAALDNWVQMAQSRGTRVEFTFGHTPAWAAAADTLPPANLQDWDDFVRAVATRYKGRIEAYEVWNEVNSSAFYTGTVAQLVTMQQHAYNIIKSIDPAAIVLSPSFVGAGMDYMRRFCAAAGVSNIDALAVHLYPWPLEEPAPEFRIPGWIDTYRQYLKDFGAGDKPIWNTEYGWGENKYLPDARRQADFLARSYLLQWSSGISRVYWYAYDNDGWGTLRLANSGNPGILTEAAYAYRTIYVWMVGSAISKPCAQASNGIWSCEFTRPDGSSAVVVWRVFGITSYPAGSFTTYEDLHGQRFRIAQNTVTVGSSPILLERIPGAQS